MVTSGFKRDEPIRSRTFDLRAEDKVLAAKLMFGDGQARGLAARLAWQMILNHFRSHPDQVGDAEASRVMQSLLLIPAVFERSGSSNEDLMVAQAVRQNVKAQFTLPMNTLEWAGMILRTAGLKLGSTGLQAQSILLCMQRCTSKYDKHIEVDAYEVQPVAKRARKGRKKAATAVAAASLTASGDGPTTLEPDEDRLRIGRRRLTAITNVLSHCTAKSYKALEMHLVWVGDYAISACSDDTLGCNWIWPGSLPDPDACPDEAQLVARDAASRAHQELMAQGVSVKPMKYEELLTPTQHEMVFEKAFHCYEDEALHLTDRHQWKSLIPKPETWSAYRSIIQHWDSTIRSCCERDLPKEEFEELEKAIRYGDAMDSQIMGMIKRYPKNFHIGMIPDMKTTFQAPDAMDLAMQEQLEAEQAKWQGELRLFKSNLHLDWKVIKRTEVGSTALHDILEWNDAQHVREQGRIGKSLVEQFMNINFPKATAGSWGDVPGAVSMAVQSVHAHEGTPKNPPRILAILDFNVPNARDSLKLKEIAQATSTIFKNFGVERCAVLAHMAAYPKEDNDTDPLDDEINIKNIFSKAGFCAQQRVRMLLAQPTSIESTLRVGDWHADSRLLYLAANDVAARGEAKNIHGNDWRMKSELARTTQITVRPTLPTPQELLHVTGEASHDYVTADSRINKEDKAAQRGPAVATAYLQAALAKASVSSSDRADASWLQPGEETWILDLTPWVGDRALASLELMNPTANHGLLRHLFVDPGYKRMGTGVSFSYARVANEVASQWMAWTRILHDIVKDARGQVTKVPKQPIDSVPDPDEAVLKATPGAYEAWKGLSALEFKMCVVRGPKIVIAPEKVAEFQHAPLSISEEVRALEREHGQFEDLLSFMATAIQPGSTGEGEDPRDPQGEDKTETQEFIKFESLAALEAHAPNMVEHGAMGDKHVTMLKDDQRGEVWVIAKGDDHILPKATCLGGYGGGNLLPRNLASSDVVAFVLPNGDKTTVQIVLGSDDDSKAKPKTGTLYSLSKPLEKQAAKKGASLTITAYGKLKPEGTAGKHHYTFEFPDGNPRHSAMDYFLTRTPARAPTSSSGIFFIPSQP